MDPPDLSAWNLNPSQGGYPPSQPYSSDVGYSGFYPTASPCGLPEPGYPPMNTPAPVYPMGGFPNPTDGGFNIPPANYGAGGIAAYPGNQPFGGPPQDMAQGYPFQQPTYPVNDGRASFGMNAGHVNPSGLPGQNMDPAVYGGTFGNAGIYDQIQSQMDSMNIRPGSQPQPRPRPSGSQGKVNQRLTTQYGDIFAPTLKPHPNFNATEDCEKLRKAMKGIGTDEQAIINILGHRSVDQRTRIVLQFKTMYGKDLRKELRSELSGHFHQCVDALCQSAVEFDASQLRKAVKGAGTDEEALIEILCTRTNEQITDIKAEYAKLYPGRSLEKDVISDTSHHFKRLLVSMLQANRDESQQVNQQEAHKDAEELYKAGEKKLGTDESTFNRILASKSFPHLQAVFGEYSKISKNSIEKALKSEMSGDLLRAHLAIVRCIENKPKYFAYELKKSMKGLGTRDTKLIRIIVSRCEVDLEKIKEEFLKENGKTLQNWITDDTTGDYRKLLLALVGN